MYLSQGIKTGIYKHIKHTDQIFIIKIYKYIKNTKGLNVIYYGRRLEASDAGVGWWRMGQKIQGGIFSDGLDREQCHFKRPLIREGVLFFSSRAINFFIA